MSNRKGTVFSPFVLGEEELLSIIKQRQSTDWINSMKLACTARMFPLWPQWEMAAIENGEDDQEASDVDVINCYFVLSVCICFFFSLSLRNVAINSAYSSYFFPFAPSNIVEEIIIFISSLS